MTKKKPKSDDKDQQTFTLADFPSGAHALAAKGAKTEAVIKELVSGPPASNAFAKRDQDDFKQLADALNAGWSDAQSAQIVARYADSINHFPLIPSPSAAG